MKQTRNLMVMPVTVEIVDCDATKKDIEMVYGYFKYIDQTFSTYKKTSEISKINTGRLDSKDCSSDMIRVLKLCEETKKETDGYFDINLHGKLDPSGVVKGWAIYNASKLLRRRGVKNFYVEAGGDIQVYGKNQEGSPWIIGIRNPFNLDEIIKVLKIHNLGVATSGTYLRGQHVYDPYFPDKKLKRIVSFTVIGPNILEADRFATAAFAMQEQGIYFIEKLKDFEGYMIDSGGIATYTTGFNKYVVEDIMDNTKGFLA